MADTVHLGDLSLACAWALVDELVQGGVGEACLSPGSRSTPIALALARHPGVRLHMHLDERSSAFFALGLAKASRRPVIIACTSGTAAAEFLPALVEASRSRMPLLALTADRPPRLRGTGANQTIDQVGLYGGYVRECLDLPVPETPGQEAWWGQSARQALEASRTDPTGPVHVNCPFDEPLSPTPDVALPPPAHGVSPPATWPGDRQALAPDRPAAELTAEEGDRLDDMVSGARGAVVMGDWEGDLAGDASYWAQTLGWPIVAEPIAGGARQPQLSLAAGQALLGDAGWIERHRPEVVIQVGATPTTRATQSFVAGPERLIVADRLHPDSDPERNAAWRLAVDADALRHALTGHRLQPAPVGWTDDWREADLLARAALDRFLDDFDRPFEPRIARDVAAWIPEHGTLFVGNSTPVRDLDLTMEPRTGVRVLANRGASGIDGLVSTALGIATADPREDPTEGARGSTVALLGDLSFLYDSGALLWAGRDGADLVIVVVRNGGGEVFSSLPQRELPEHRDLFVTPHGLDLSSLCTAAGVGHARVDRAASLVPALDDAAGAGGLRVVEVIVDPLLASRLRIDLRDAIADALTG